MKSHTTLARARLGLAWLGLTLPLYALAQLPATTALTYLPPPFTPITPTTDKPNPYLVFTRPPVQVAPVPTPVIVLPAIQALPAWQIPSFTPTEEAKPAPQPMRPTPAPLSTWQIPLLTPTAPTEPAKPVPAPAVQTKKPFFELPAMPAWQLPPFFPTEVAKPAPVPAAEKPKAVPGERTLADLGESLRSYFTDEEVDLLVEYMKESVMASFKGEEVYLPADLAFKLEVLLVRLQKEGGLYMDNLIKQMERDLKNSLKNKPEPKVAPPSLPPAAPASNSGAPATKRKSKAENSISAAIDEWLKSLKPR